MKTFSIAFFVFACFSFTQAQVAAVYYDAGPFPHRTVARTLSAEEMYNAHTQLAVEVMTRFLAEELVYPKHLSGYGIEETVAVKLYLNDQGEVADYSIQDDPHSPFYSALQKALSQLPVVPVSESEYRGGHQIVIPVRFHECDQD